MLRLCLGFSLALSLALSLTAADWTRFRGPNGSGVAEGTLPTIDPKAPLWKIALPGKGSGSPIVVAGKLFLQSSNLEETKRVLLCYDAVTGKPLWTKDHPGQPVKKGIDGVHALNTVASSTPASDGERVYCVWWDGVAVSVNAYDLNGKDLWEQPLGSFKAQHGVGHSPAVYKGKVFVNFDQDGQAVVVAFDAKTGMKAWSAPRKPERACYTTPMVLEQPGKPGAVVVFSTHEIDSYDPDTGKVNWHYSIESNKLRAVGTPVLAGDLLIGYFGEGGGTGSRYAVAVKADGTGDVTGTAKAWDKRKDTPYVPSLLVKGDYLYWVYDKGGVVYCAEAKTGKVVWNQQILKGDTYSSPILVGDQIVAIAESGQIAVLKADKTFAEPTLTDLGEKVYATPAFADGKLYIRGDKSLFCFGKK